MDSNFDDSSARTPQHPPSLGVGRAAANDDHRPVSAELPFALRDMTALARVCREMLDAPDDLPLADMAIKGLEISICTLAERDPTFRALANRICDVAREQPLGIVEGATLMALQRRLGRHQLYASALAIARANDLGSIDPVVLETMGARFALRILRNVQPARTAIVNAIAAIENPKGPHALAWSGKARARAYVVAERQLQEAIKESPNVAAGYGLVEIAPRIVRSSDPIDVFNREFRRRCENLEDYACLSMVAATGGNGTLSVNVLRESGDTLLSMVRTGDSGAALVCLEVVSHLTSKTTLKLPLQLGAVPPAGALAWLNVPGGEYCYLLYKVIERAARPSADTRQLYEDTIQVVVIRLTPPLADFYREAARTATGTPGNVLELLGDVGHHPRSAVVGDGVYRITARRLQESVPAVLIGADHHRWPVALVTNSSFLVARGRPVYGACRNQKIDGTAAAACKALGWPAPASSGRQELVGSFTTIRPESVRRVFEHLCMRAQEVLRIDSVESSIVLLNRHAAWIAAFLALVLALRRWIEYDLDGDELRNGMGCRVNDKDVHAQKGLAVPLVPLVGQVLKGWDSLVRRVRTALISLGNARANALANRLEQWLIDGRQGTAVFTVDATDELERVGYLTWNTALPPNLRIRPSFGRQFWPLQLMDRGIEQLLIDVLTRDQVDGLYIGSSNRVNVVAEDLARLRAAMEETLEALAISIPDALRGG